MVNSAVNAAVGAGKTVKNEMKRAAAGSETVQHGFGNGNYLRGLNFDLAGAGDVIVHAGVEAPWHAEIRAPEAMFTRIVCQEEDGILYVRIPQASQFGFFGFNFLSIIGTFFRFGSSLFSRFRDSRLCVSSTIFVQQTLFILTAPNFLLFNEVTPDCSSTVIFGFKIPLCMFRHLIGTEHDGIDSGRNIIRQNGSTPNPVCFLDHNK